MNVVWESIYAHRPEAAYRCRVNGKVIGTVFKNFEGWCWAVWGENRNADVAADEADARQTLLSQAAAT